MFLFSDKILMKFGPNMLSRFLYKLYKIFIKANVYNLF